MECFACRGLSEVCEVCNGKTRIEFRRCPRRNYGSAELLVCLAATFLENGQLPIGGIGWAELPAKLVDGIALVASERTHIRGETPPPPPD